MNASSTSAVAPHLSVDDIRAIEQDLSEPTFRDVPVGPAISSLLGIELYIRHGDWRFRNTLKNRLRFIYHHLRPFRQPESDVSCCRGRVLVTWYEANFRCTDLVLPVAKQLGPERCVLLYRSREIVDLVPPDAASLHLSHAMSYDVRAWRRDYGLYWSRIRPLLARIVTQFGFPPGVYHRLADAILTCTQSIAGYQEFLHRARPAAILTEYDRNASWAPLILSAKAFGIPTYTMVHGVMGDEAIGFYPLLADKIFCWGRLDQAKLIAAGLDPNRTVIAGCPRLTRTLLAETGAARIKLGLNPQKPVVMLATDPFPLKERLQFAEGFCSAVRGENDLSAVVRLHPVEDLKVYADLALRFPTVKFTTNDAWTVDEALSAADIIVTHCSGLGSDALIKGRLVVVLDMIDVPLGHGKELVVTAGCPRAKSPEELRDILRRLLNSETERQRYRLAADRFSSKFCAFFGDDAACRTASHILSCLPKGLDS